MAKPPFFKLKDHVGGFAIYLEEYEYDKRDQGWWGIAHLVFIDDDEGSEEICWLNYPGPGPTDEEGADWMAIKRNHLTPLKEGLDWLEEWGMPLQVNPTMLRRVLQDTVWSDDLGRALEGADRFMGNYPAPGGTREQS